MQMRWMPENESSVDRTIHYAEALSDDSGFENRSLSWPNWQHGEGIRELVFAPLPYLAVYRIRAEVIEVLHIYHAARNWQGGLARRTVARRTIWTGMGC